MAAVGLSAADATEMCKNHPQVNVACNNAEDNVTVSGPADAVNKFVEELKAKNIFAKEVKSYGIAFHSPAMQKASPIYLEALKKVNKPNGDSYSILSRIIRRNHSDKFEQSKNQLRRWRMC